jgi:hypothetical protein
VTAGSVYVAAIVVAAFLTLFLKEACSANITQPVCVRNCGVWFEGFLKVRCACGGSRPGTRQLLCGVSCLPL